MSKFSNRVKDVFKAAMPTLEAVTPAIAAAIGGPIPLLASVAVRQLATALGSPPDTSPEQVALQLAGATPEHLIAMRNADLDFQKSLAEMGLKEIELSNSDRANARARETQSGDRTAAHLAYAVTAGFFLTLFTVLLVDLPDGAHDVAMVMVGSLGTAWAGVMTYYFGSSVGSKTKERSNDSLADVIKTLTARAGASNVG